MQSGASEPHIRILSAFGMHIVQISVFFGLEPGNEMIKSI